MSKITSIEIQKRDKNRVSIFVDNKFYIGISLYTCSKYKLKIGDSIDEENFKKILEEENFEEGKNYVSKYLLGKPEKIIREKMKLKGYEEKIIERVVNFLQKYKLIDDEKYAKAYANDASKLKKQSAKRIEQALKGKGINQEYIRAALISIDDKTQLESATKKLRSKITEFTRKSKNERELTNRCYVYLQRNGFDSKIIKDAINEMKKDSH